MRAIKGASGRDSEYAPNDPKEVMMVRRSNAGIGSSSEPTKMFCFECTSLVFSLTQEACAKITHQDDGSRNTP